jgi:hypothetical protein
MSTSELGVESRRQHRTATFAEVSDRSDAREANHVHAAGAPHDGDVAPIRTRRLHLKTIARDNPGDRR